MEREFQMVKFLLRGLISLCVLVLAACAAENAQTGERGIDQDIASTHGSGSTLDNIGNQFAPWRLYTLPP
jgi:hypothetical protein